MQPLPDPVGGPRSALRTSPGINRRRGIVIIGLLVLVFGAGLAVAFGADARLLLDALRQHHYGLLTFVAGAPILAAFLFMAVYALAVAVSIPGVAVLTVIGGYLFGWLQGTLYVVLAATLGATAVFLLARSAAGATLRTRAGPSLQRFAAGFRRNALSYSFVLNLVPVLPFAVVIAIPAVCGVRLHVFAAGMFLGLLPWTFLFARLGSGLGDVLSRDLPLRLASLVTPEILLSLAGLGALALLPVAVPSLRRRFGL